MGAGYTETLGKFMAANMADAAVKAKQRMRWTALPQDDATAEARAAAQTTLNEAIAAQTKAHAELYATGAGPIYRAGIAEWRAKGAVENSDQGVEHGGRRTVTTTTTNCEHD